MEIHKDISKSVKWKYPYQNPYVYFHYNGRL